jgi:hypothetical protein
MDAKKECFNIIDGYDNDYIINSLPENCGTCNGKVINSKLLKQCQTCEDMNKESQGYIEGKICCSCIHFQWGMGEMGVCNLRSYKTFNDIGEWSDTCSIDKYEYKLEI